MTRDNATSFGGDPDALRRPKIRDLARELRMAGIAEEAGEIPAPPRTVGRRVDRR